MNLPPPDINRDRIMCMMGGSTVLLHNGIMQRFSDPGPVWVNLVPTTDFDRFQPRPFRIMHEYFIGTVDEIASCLRDRLSLTFDVLTNYGGVIPGLDEASLRKQTDVFAQHGFDRFTVGPDLKADHSDLENAEAARCKRLQLSNVHQDSWTRWELMRIVAQYYGRRFGSAHEGTLPPTDHPEMVQELIDALTVLRDDAKAALGRVV